MVSFTLGSMSTPKENMNVYVVGRRIVRVRLVADSLKGGECYCTHLIAWHGAVNSITELSTEHC